MNITLENKVVVITGSSRGIGRELAKAFAKEGAHVVVNYVRNEKAAREIYDEISKFNKECMLCKADVTDYDAMVEMSHKVMEKYHRVDILINNAGLCDDNLLPFMTPQQWKNILDVNLTGVFNCCKAFGRIMIKQKEGRIFNISSLKGQEGCAGQLNYSASKAGLIGMTKALAKEMGVHGVMVNAICPGFIVTDLNRHNSEKADIAKRKSLLSIEYSMQDLQNFMLLFSSECIQGISGRVFNLDSRVN